MGAAAFVMAEMLGLNYSSIALSALVPALLYFLSVGLMVYFEAERRELSVIDAAKIPGLTVTLKHRFYLLFPLAVLVYLLVFKHISPMLSGFYSICVLLVACSAVSLKKDGRLPARETIAALKYGMKTAVPVAMACASAGLVIGITSLTGLGVRFTQMVVELSGGRLWLCGILTMTACIILGMGLPTTAAYIITSVLCAPALIDMGVSPLSAHMFILYYAIISFITPPVAISAFAASGIANTSALNTGFMAFKLGLAGFIVPFLFLYSPSILLTGEISDILIGCISGILGIAALAGSLIGWCFIRLSRFSRCVFFVSAIALILPAITMNIAGAVALILVFLTRRPAPGKKSFREKRDMV